MLFGRIGRKEYFRKLFVWDSILGLENRKEGRMGYG